MEPVTVRDIEKLMADTGWTQEQFASALGASQAAVSQWLSGGRNVGPYYARKIREMLADANSTEEIETRARLHCVIDDLPEEALPIVAAMLDGLARHYGG
jgi:transcriptional regulator with XRE-family HTH domain